MTIEEIVEMALQAGLSENDWQGDSQHTELKLFAELIEARVKQELNDKEPT